MVTLDIELYENYLLIIFKMIETDKVQYFEMFPGQPLDCKKLAGVMERNTTITFNGNSYDLPLIAAAVERWNNADLKRFSDKIIKSNRPTWSICKENSIFVPDSWDSIDLMGIAPGVASLKLYGARLHAPKIQDLPIEPNAIIEPEMRPELREYCKNDLELTELLYLKLKPQIALRVSMSEQYGIDLRSKSDPQIAETVIKSELEKKTGRTYRALKVKDGETIRYQNPQIVSFKTPELTNIFEKILAHEFELGAKIKLPKWLKDHKIKIGKGVYNMGIGGLHSTETCQMVETRDGVLCEWDVRGFYPSIILQQKLAPKSMGKNFVEVYQTVVEQRNNAKSKMQEIEKEINLLEKKELKTRISELKKEHTHYKTEAATKKVVTNSSYGKLGNKYSSLYAPELMLQTTLTGQLTLLMLIEAMENAGINIVSANTDGIVCQCLKEQEHDMETIAWDWMLTTSYELERTDYKLLAARDVNSFMAIKADGKVKRKGIFNAGGLSKNPDHTIIYDAVVNFLKDGTPIEQTINNCKDPGAFVSCRKVTGGCIWDGEYIGKSVRFYISKDSFFTDPCLHYKINLNKVPKSGGCRPLMEMESKVPADLNYKAYIDEAEKLLLGVGWNKETTKNENNKS